MPALGGGLAGATAARAVPEAKPEFKRPTNEGDLL
jgi:hypothetical protein